MSVCVCLCMSCVCPSLAGCHYGEGHCAMRTHTARRWCCCWSRRCCCSQASVLTHSLATATAPCPTTASSFGCMCTHGTLPFTVVRFPKATHVCGCSARPILAVKTKYQCSTVFQCGSVVNCFMLLCRVQAVDVTSQTLTVPALPGLYGSDYSFANF